MNSSITLRLKNEGNRNIWVPFVQSGQVFFRSELSNDEMIKKEKLFRCLNGLPDDAFQKKPQPIQKRYILVLTKLMWAIIKG